VVTLLKSPPTLARVLVGKLGARTPTVKPEDNFWSQPDEEKSTIAQQADNSSRTLMSSFANLV